MGKKSFLDSPMGKGRWPPNCANKLRHSIDRDKDYRAFLPSPSAKVFGNLQLRTNITRVLSFLAIPLLGAWPTIFPITVRFGRDGSLFLAFPPDFLATNESLTRPMAWDFQVGALPL